MERRKFEKKLIAFCKLFDPKIKSKLSSLGLINLYLPILLPALDRQRLIIWLLIALQLIQINPLHSLLLTRFFLLLLTLLELRNGMRLPRLDPLIQIRHHHLARLPSGTLSTLTALQLLP